MRDLADDVKQKREFSGLPDSLVYRALILNKKDVKKTRAFLRKYFGVFMTNKVIKLGDRSVLKSHISSRKRDYDLLYKKIFSAVGFGFKEVLDLGCGVNGFSYYYLKDVFGDVRYLGVEATRQLADSQNEFFAKTNANARVEWIDLLEIGFIKELFLNTNFPRLIFMFQVIDALENVKPNYSKDLLLEIKDNMDKDDVIIISNSTKSISGKNAFSIKRRWLEEFISNNFCILDRFELFDEDFFVIKK